MLGWNIYVRKKNKAESNDHQYDIASWNASVGGLSWIDDLVKSGNAVLIGGDGYPVRYSIKAEVFRSVILKGIPSNNSLPVVGDDYYFPKGYTGSLEINREILNECPDKEELIIIAWDLS